MSDDKKSMLDTPDKPTREQLEQQIAELTGKVTQYEEQERIADSGVVHSPLANVNRVDQKGPQYTFTVKGRGKSGAKLPVREIVCGDECEAKRIYCITTEDPHPDRPGQQINPTDYHFDIVNQGQAEVTATIQRKTRARVLQTRFTQGITMTDKERSEMERLSKEFPVPGQAPIVAA